MTTTRPPDAPTSLREGGALERLGRIAARLFAHPTARLFVVPVDPDLEVGPTLHLPVPAGRRPVVVPDTRTDARFRDLPPIDGGEIGHLLAVPLVAADGHLLGALYVVGPGRREWSPGDVALLERLAGSVSVELEIAALTAQLPAERLSLEAAVDAARIGTFDWDLVTGRLFWDDRMLDLFGYARETFAETIDEFTLRVHPEDRTRVDAAIASAVASCGRYEADYRIVLPDGSMRWIDARGQALPGPDGGAAHLLGVALELTDRRREEAQIARVLESMPVAFFSVDAEWRLTYLNAESERLLDRPREEVLHGPTLWEVLPHAVGRDFERHVRGGLESGRTVAFEDQHPSGTWYEVRVRPTDDGLSISLVDATARRAERDRAEREAVRARLLADVTSRLVGTLDQREGVARLAQVICPSLADWCVITLIGDDDPVSLRGLRDVGWWHGDPERRALVGRYARTRLDALGEDSHLARVLRSGEPTLLPTGADDQVRAVLRPGPAYDVLTELAPQSAVILPLRGRGGIVGLLSAFTDQGRSLTPENLSTLQEAVDRAGLAVDNARLYARQRDLAQSLQRSLLTDPPERPGLDIAVRYLPAAAAAQVGGDWYDVFVQRDDATTLVIGDVVGHDNAAVAAMGQLRGLLRGIALSGTGDPLGVVTQLDEVLLGLGVEVTASVVVARLDRGRLRWANAGHPPPVLVRPDGETVLLSRPSSDLLLGIDPATPRHEQAIAVRPGDTVLLYTDGLVEQRGRSLDEGTDLLLRTLTDLHDRPLETLCDDLPARMLGGQSEDDVAVLAVRLTADEPTVAVTTTRRPGRSARS